MDTPELLTHFNRLADAPGAIPRLRRLVLDLAVRGKLVAQDPGDEPAKLPASGLCRNGPYQLPNDWFWVSVGEISDSRLGKMLDRAKNRGTLRPYLRNINVRWFGFDLSDLSEMPLEDSELDEFSLRRGDVLICEGGEPGRAAVWHGQNEGIYFQKAIHRVRFQKFVDPHFFVFVLKASADDGRLAENFTGTGIKHLTGKGLAAFLFPLPPLAEQHRIIAKVDELMGLLDQIEARQTAREATRRQLTTASLARLSTSDTSPDDFRDHARFLLDHLPAHTTRRDQIKQLRQTILNLAVRGRLGPQDSSEAPIFVSSTIKSDQWPFELPRGWVWAELGDLCTKTGSGSTPRGGKEVYRDSGIPFLRSQNIYNDGLKLDDVAFIDPATHARMIGTRVEPGDLLLNITGGSIGRCAVVTSGLPEANVSQHVAIIRPEISAMAAFLHKVIVSPHFQAYVFGEQTGAGRGGLPKNRMDRIPIPIPPLAEQHRIVAKVNELMTLCDHLDAALDRAEAHRTRLLDAELHVVMREL